MDSPAAQGRPFAEALIEEGQRTGNPRQYAALDTAPSRGMGEHLAPDLDRREGAPLYGHADDRIPEAELTWGDLLDVINPLHHIPIVANVYRVLSGDTISGPARVAGATLYGGPIGMIAGAATAAMAEANGADLGDTLVAGLLGQDPPGGEPAGSETLLAEAVTAEPLREPAAPIQDGTVSVVSGFAPQPQTPAPAMSGDAALSALLGDLRAGGQALTVETGPAQSNVGPGGMTAVPVAAVRAEPLPARNSGGPNPAAGLISSQAPDAAPVQAFPARMMEGLDKYRAMAIERGGAGRPALKVQ